MIAIPFSLFRVCHPFKEPFSHIIISVSSTRLPSIGQVKNVLKQLNARKATGADNIPAWVFKRFVEKLDVVTNDIITASIVQIKYPTMYKHALVSPVPKVHLPEKHIIIISELVWC